MSPMGRTRRIRNRMKTSRFVRCQKGGMAFSIQKTCMVNLLRDYQFGFGRGGGK